MPSFNAIRYHNVYPGIDWLIYGNHRDLLEYDFVVHPHADPARIALAVTGAKRVSVDRDGGLRISVEGRILRQPRPVVYQVSANGTRRLVKGSYALAHGYARIVLGHYDDRRTLFIDPILEYSTYFGGTSSDYGHAIALDTEGDIYVAGEADSSADFQTANPYQAVNFGDDAFVAKFDPSGTHLLYSTFLGGSNGASISGIAVDSAGSIYVAGTTASKNFPVANAFQSQFKGTDEAAEQGFLTKFSPDGSTLEYSTYLGGSGLINSISALAVDSAQDAYVVGYTDSTDFPTTAGAVQGSLTGRLNAFITKFDPSGDSLGYSTYLGGGAADQANAIAVDPSGDAYVDGNTNSTDFPLVHAFQSTNYASANGSTTPTAFVAKLNAQGSALAYSSYLGGDGADVALGIAVDTAGNAYVTGSTDSSDFPTVNAYQSTNQDVAGLGGPSAFVTKVNSTGTTLIYSTYLGGSGGGQGILGDEGRAVTVDSAGDAYVTGYTASTDFPTVNAVQETNDAAAIGATNVFVSEFDPSGSKLLFSTYLGGSGSWGPASSHTSFPFGDIASAMATDGSGDIYITGQTGSANFPTESAFQSTNKTATQYGSAPVAFVAKFGIKSSAPLPAKTSGGGGGIEWEVLMLLTLALPFRRHVSRNDP